MIFKQISPQEKRKNLSALGAFDDKKTHALLDFALLK